METKHALVLFFKTTIQQTTQNLSDVRQFKPTLSVLLGWWAELSPDQKREVGCWGMPCIQIWSCSSLLYSAILRSRADSLHPYDSKWVTVAFTVHFKYPPQWCSCSAVWSHLWWPMYLDPLMCPTPLQPGVGQPPSFMVSSTATYNHPFVTRFQAFHGVLNWNVQPPICN